MDFWGKNEDWTTYALIHEKHEPNMTFWVDGNPVAAGGLAIPFPGVAEAWIYLPKGSITAGVLLAIRHQLDEWIKEYELHRVQALTEYLWKASRRFLESLGMEYEGRLRKYIAGIDFALYSRVS